MRALGVFAFVLWQGVAGQEPPLAQPEYLRYERAITLPQGTGQACAVLDAGVFPHAAPSLRDVRVFPVGQAVSPGNAAHEVPFVITLSQTETEETVPVQVLNRGTAAGGKISFDLQMPGRAYSDVRLTLDGRDFLATASVWGEDAPGGKRTSLGSFTLFELSSQHLSHNTTLPLVESTFPYLHVEMSVAKAPGTSGASQSFGPAMVAGAEVPPSRTAQTLYSPVAETRTIVTTGRESRAEIEIPERVPVERVSFEMAPGFNGNFSRDVRIVATPEPAKAEAANQSEGKAADKIASGEDLRRGALPEETLGGSILRVHTTEAGREISTDQLGFPAVIGANLQSPARVQIALENGDDRPLPIAAVRLEMRQRKLCFDTGPDTAGGVALFYGDPALEVPSYDYQRLFRPSATALLATLGPELANPTFHPRPATAQSFAERHPEVLWIALIAVICALGMVALRSARRVGTTS